MDSLKRALKGRLDVRLNGQADRPGGEEFSSTEIAFIAACIRTLADSYPKHRHEVLFAAVVCDEVPPARLTGNFDTSEIYRQAERILEITLGAAQSALHPSHSRVVLVPRRRKYNGADPETSRLVKARKLAESKAPKSLDLFREHNVARGQDRVDNPPRWHGAVPGRTLRAGFSSEGASVALVGMHWLEHGGAEEWAVQSAEIACAQGFGTVVMTSLPGHLDLFARLESVGADVRPVGSVLFGGEVSAWFEYVSKMAPSVVLVHHCAALYRALPEWRLRARLPMWVMDSTHIIEHKSGGYVHDSILYSPFIDLHHVISPELRDFYVFRGGVHAEKVAFHPLTDQTLDLSAREPDVVAIAERGLRVGFLGRYVRQKRPQLFLRAAAYASRLCARIGVAKPTFVMQGDGPLRQNVESAVAKFSSKAAVELRGWGDKAAFFEGIDLLLVSSENEGLTLTSLEAIAAGVPVLSSDVGSQVTVIGAGGLLPRDPLKFEHMSAKRIARLAEDPSILTSLLTRQRGLARELMRNEPAGHFLARELKGR